MPGQDEVIETVERFTPTRNNDGTLRFDTNHWLTRVTLFPTRLLPNFRVYAVRPGTVGEETTRTRVSDWSDKGVALIEAPPGDGVYLSSMETRYFGRGQPFERKGVSASHYDYLEIEFETSIFKFSNIVGTLSISNIVRTIVENDYTTTGVLFSS